MFKFFAFKRQETKIDFINSLVVPKLDRIIELLEQQHKESTAKNIHFDHVHIEHLENIVFRLDNIEIEELSGKLVIGNNISSTEELAESLILKVDKDKAKKDTMTETSSSHHTQMEKTSKGFRFRKDF